MPAYFRGEIMKTLRQYIEEATVKHSYYTGVFAVCMAHPCIETGDAYTEDFDKKAWDMHCDRCGEDIVYTWVEYDGKIGCMSRQPIKYGVKPGTCDGGDLTPYITKYGHKYWLDEFSTYVKEN